MTHLSLKKFKEVLLLQRDTGTGVPLEGGTGSGDNSTVGISETVLHIIVGTLLKGEVWGKLEEFAYPPLRGQAVEDEENNWHFKNSSIEKVTNMKGECQVHEGNQVRDIDNDGNGSGNSGDREEDLCHEWER
ncbi:hypothetical protein HD554DRAFT_2037467 [Boletus coccyginus]|nr:hypothetical protein HD554DRAFT_2037467 [Boletus coccyginus]